jgi:hypothetical protein
MKEITKKENYVYVIAKHFYQRTFLPMEKLGDTNAMSSLLDNCRNQLGNRVGGKDAPPTLPPPPTNTHKPTYAESKF